MPRGEHGAGGRGEAENRLISPDAIADYQARVGFLKAAKWSFFQVVSNSESAEQFIDLRSGFLAGTRTASELLSWIDRKIQMMRQEGN